MIVPSLPYQYRPHLAELPERRPELRDLFRAMKSGIPSIRLELFSRPPLDRVGGEFGSATGGLLALV
jgi:hypothetical protein